MSTLESTPDVLDVTGYAAAVRRSLADLGREQADDLTDGLEADLADALADADHARHGGDLVAQFGSPDDYAAELRAAAGLGSAAGAHAGGPWRRLGGLLREQRAGLRTQPWWPGVARLGTAARPLWWVVRGWVAFMLLDRWFGAGGSQWFPSGGTGRLALVALMIASIWLGQSRVRRGRRLVLALNVALALGLLVVAPAVSRDQAWQADAASSGVAAPAQDGVVVDGIQAGNLFVYDAQGNPLHDVQVFDDRGRPVRTSGDGSTVDSQSGEPWTYAPRTAADGRTMWNVYPLLGAPAPWWEYDGEGQLSLTPGHSLQVAPLPFEKAPAVAPAEGGPAPAPTPAPTPAASPAPTR
ncbi:HAAS signaling domain-containing protein [Cellulomonas alba]|uniref:Uncharacterized protein n=1 Tax=Cellulomonas alba TaxID=3053467 RepID=A0ABT7SHC4_9CELL|nr:hypothetical protein [Cellulomonas alba]MDM7855597.1 hypothetical protein [Cellulomonas alba]